jgi:hypothetical protein
VIDDPFGDVVLGVFDELSERRECRVCGCTDRECKPQCIELMNGEPCHWVEQDLCSACVSFVRR